MRGFVHELILVCLWSFLGAAIFFFYLVVSAFAYVR